MAWLQTIRPGIVPWSLRTQAPFLFLFNYPHTGPLWSKVAARAPDITFKSPRCIDSSWISFSKRLSPEAFSTHLPMLLGQNLFMWPCFAGNQASPNRICFLMLC